VDSEVVTHRLSRFEIAQLARCSRRAVTRHSKHLSEVLHQERKQSPLIVNYAPVVNVIVLPGPGSTEGVEGDEAEKNGHEVLS
jgi:hypothetical protein